MAANLDAVRQALARERQILDPRRTNVERRWTLASLGCTSCLLQKARCVTHISVQHKWWGSLRLTCVEQGGKEVLTYNKSRGDRSHAPAASRR